MAIPFQLPRCSEGADDYQDLDRLLGDLFVVLARILAQRGQVAGESVATLSAGRGAVTIRRPSSRQLRLQVSDEEVDLELSSEDSSDADSSVPPSPTSPTAPMPIPDLVSSLPTAQAAQTAPVAEQTTDDQPARTAVAAVAVRSRTRKPRTSPRKERSPKGKRGKRASATSSPAKGEKELTRTPSTRAPKATPTVC